MVKPTIKYLDKYGDYQYATVIDIGDVEKLTTPIKTDLVGAINSLIESGIAVPDSVITNINDLNSIVETIRAGGLNEAQLLELQKAIDEANKELARQIKFDYDELDKKLVQAREDYDAKVLAINNSITGVENNLISARTDLDDARKRLATAELNVTTVTQTVDDINGVIVSKVDSTDFELLESTVNSHGTAIEQTKEDIQLLATKESLDLATGDIQQLQSDLTVTAEAITGTVKKAELIGELEGLDIYPINLLRGTRQWYEWQSTIVAKAYATSDTYQHATIQEQVGFDAYLYRALDGLEIGQSYTASIWARSASTHVKPVFKIRSTNHEMINAKTSDGFLNDVWQRYTVSFVADKTTDTVGFTTISSVSGDVVQFAGAKVEKGTKNTGWREHEDDSHNRLTTAESTLRQTAESISSIVAKQVETDEGIASHTTQIEQLSESITLQAESLTKQGEDISSMSASLEVNAEAIATKVSQTEINESIADIKIDNKNAILNSDFAQDFEGWEAVSSVFKVVTIDGRKWAQASRSGLTGDIVSTVTSNMTPASVGQRINIGMDIMIANTSLYDNQTMFVLDMLNASDTRVDTKVFEARALGVTFQNGVAKRINVSHKIEREDVAKVRLRLSLYRNGTVSYTNILLQKGDIGVTEWTPNPSDTQSITAKLSTEITQTASMIELKADKTVVNDLTGEIEQLSSSINQTAESITSTVTAYTNKVDGFEKRIESTLYSWTMWADDDKGKNMSMEPENRKWFGVAYNKGTIDPPADVSHEAFQWSKVGADGTPILSLTNDLVALPADQYGVVSDYTHAKTDIIIHQESEDVTGEWKIVANPTNGINGILTGNSYQITAMTTDVGEVSFTATKDGTVLNRIMGVSVQRSGESAKAYRIRKSHPIILKEKTGILMPNIVTFTSEEIIGQGGYKQFNAYYVIYERSTSALTVDEYTHLKESGLIMPDREYIISDITRPYVERYRSKSPESIKEYVPSSVDIASIHIEVYGDKETTNLLDNETIMVASEGKDGEDSYRVEVLSTQGNTFKNGIIETWIYATVYRGMVDITANIDANRFRWTRYSENEVADKLWNDKYFGGVKEVKITSQDIYQRATFMCDILSQ